MRKNLFVLLAAALMVVTGCKKDDNTAGNDNGAKMTFTATIDNGGSKTTIEGVDMNWTKGDVISINGKDFTADEAGASTTFTGDEVGKKDGKYMAYYLVTMGEGGSLSLPASQTYAGANLAGVNPMYAESTATTLLFHNICALIKLDLKGTGSVKTITASANQPLKGTFEILTNQDGGYYAHATSTADADKSVVLNCGNGEALDGTAAKTFYIALPQGEYTGLKFTLSDGTYTYPIEISGNKTLTAGIMYGKEVAGVEFVAPVPEGALKGKFSVSATKQVYFSEGNLWCDNTGSSPVWHFEKNQYDYHTYGTNSNVQNGQTSSNKSKEWGLFYWSTDDDGNNWGMRTDNNSSYVDGNFKDWGIAYCNSEQNTWRTLSGGPNSEWNYLIKGRSGDKAPDFGENTDCRYALIKVNNILGLLVFPDVMDWPNGLTLPSHINKEINSSPTNYTIGDFSKLEEEGAVFLPCAGQRSKTSVSNIGERARYQSSTPDNASTGYHKSYCYFFYSSKNNPENSDYSYTGCSVRLVHEAN